MLCAKCHKNLATVRYAEVVDGRVTDIHLCAECLARQQDAVASGFALSGPVPAAKSGPPPVSPRPRAKVSRSCVSCGAKLSMVLENGKVGCSQCYTQFSADIEPMLAALHGNTQHVGKTSKMGDVRTRLCSDLQTKRSLLRSALEMERYEEAAALRDGIRELETVLGASFPAEG
jgi:protein arginine kinase activator